MVTKTALILLFLAMPVMGHDIVDTFRWTRQDTLSFNNELMKLAPKDTTRYYIKEIKQKCDTTSFLDRGWRCLYCKNDGSYCQITTLKPIISCVDDTVWADKVQVWLTPAQIKAMAAIIQERIETWEWKKRWLDIIRNGEAPTRELKE